MDCYQVDHLELVLPTQFTKPVTQPSYLTEINLNQHKKTLKFSIPDQPPPLTIVSLSKKKQTIETKARPIPSSAAKQLKKMAGKFLRPQSKQLIKTDKKKQHLLSKEELYTKLKQSQDRRAQKKGQNLVQSVEFLQIKSFNLDEQLQKLKTERRISRTTKNQSSPTEAIEKIFFSTQSIGFLGQKSCQSIIKNQTVRVSLGEEGLDRYKNIEDKLQEKQPKRKGKCFYDKLKQRLTLQIKQIKDKQQLDRTDPLLNTCNMKDFPAQEITQKFRHPPTQRARPRTGLTRTALQSCKSQRSIPRKRPQSTSAKILEKKQLQYMSRKIDQQQQKQLQNYSRIHSASSKKRHYRVAYSPDSSLTLKHISSIPQSQGYATSHNELQRQKIKEKMLNILIDCHTESINHQNLQQGVKVFEKYCQRMDSNLGRTAKMIGRIQKTQAFDEVEYL